VNTEIALYVFGLMDVNNGLSPSGFVPDREEALGAQMAQLGTALQERARERRLTVDGTTEEPKPRKPPTIPEF
jgi:hypothetical protein